MPTIVKVTTSLPTYVPKSSIHQPSNGGQPEDSPRRSWPEGDLPRKPPFNPLARPFGWPTLDHACLYHHGINHMLCNMF
jgi:hypothetical protein